jgi:hypothetical protein
MTGGSAAYPQALRGRGGPRIVGYAAVAFSGLYFLSDLIEALQGGFSDAQLWLTLAAEAAIPFIVAGLYVTQRPGLGRLGLIGAMAYGYAFAFFTGTVVYALANGTPDYRVLSDEVGVAMTLHGAVMVLSGIALGLAVRKAGVLPSWTGAALIAGVVLVALSQQAPEGVQLIAAGIRDAAFAGMGAGLLRKQLVQGGT